MIQFLNSIDIRRASMEWAEAEPFPHIVIDGFLKNPEIVSGMFPDKDWSQWESLGDQYQLNKFACSSLQLIPTRIQDVIRVLNDAPFLSVLESISGITGLIPDPYLEGGGLHLSLSGGILAPHSDFHVYGRLSLYRRLNLIVYLNENWQDGDGGELELSLPRDTTPRKLVAPLLNRAILFETNDRSIHGFTRPIRNSVERRSIALYYYTATATAWFSGDQTTHWRFHGTVPAVKKPRFWVYRFLMMVSRVFSITAQLINPNQGLALARVRLMKKTNGHKQR